MVSKCKEFSDVKLRMNEKRALNLLNKDKNKETIRYNSIPFRIIVREQVTFLCVYVALFEIFFLDRNCVTDSFIHKNESLRQKSFALHPIIDTV